jgi:5-methylthioadenosine/S-adenosylhomocysteine deaminase
MPAIRDGAVLVDGAGVIAAVGPADRIGAPEDAGTVDLGESALLPGLVNVHAHPELSALRGFLEDLPFPRWIPALMKAKRDAPLREADYAASARWSCLEAMAAGITCLGATEDSGAALDAMNAAGLRGIVYREVFGPEPHAAAAAVRVLAERVDAMRSRTGDLVRVGVSPHAPYSVSDRLFTLVARYASEESLPVAVHTAESAAESDLVARAQGDFADGLRARGIATPVRAASTVMLLERTGILDTRPLLIHCVGVTGADIARIAASGAAVAHCPAANARLGHGIAPVAEMLAAGVAVGLGTDSVAANNRLDLLEEARLAQMMQRARLRSPDMLPAERVLRLATYDGARALGLDRVIGSLEPGKDADLCAVSLAGAHVRPVHDPFAAVVHAARASDVTMTMVRGRAIFREGISLTLDPSLLRPALEDAAGRLRLSTLP